MALVRDGFGVLIVYLLHFQIQHSFFDLINEVLGLHACFSLYVRTADLAEVLAQLTVGPAAIVAAATLKPRIKRPHLVSITIEIGLPI